MANHKVFSKSIRSKQLFPIIQSQIIVSFPSTFDLNNIYYRLGKQYYYLNFFSAHFFWLRKNNTAKDFSEHLSLIPLHESWVTGKLLTFTELDTISSVLWVFKHIFFILTLCMGKENLQWNVVMQFSSLKSPKALYHH